MDHAGEMDFEGMFDALFEPDIHTNEEVWLRQSTELIVFMARELAKHEGEDPDLIHFDYIGLTQTLKRFYRDCYGVQRLACRIHGLLGKLLNAKDADDTSEVIISEVRKMGLRVTSDDPRKTRVAACFALWMSTFRPISIDITDGLFKNTDFQELFCAEFTLALTEEYLCRDGVVDYGTNPTDRQVRVDHIIHDFQCRSLSHSALEMLYCSIFRPK